MKRILRKYLDFVRQPDVARLLAVAVFARMPIGMVGFAMVMFLREALGSFALAGSAVGINFVALAACAPIQGRIIDRYGPRWLLLVTGVVQPVALLAVLVLARSGASFAWLAAASALSGAFASPITTLTRTFWRNRFERDEDRRTAFALDAVSIEINFTIGPAIIGAVLAAFGAMVAFAVAIGAVVMSVIAFTASPALRYFRHDRHAERHLLGPLTEPRLLIVFGATFGLSNGFGLLEVAYPAYATSLAMPALAGALLALNSVGSALGGGIYGGLHFRAPVERQFSIALALMAVWLLLHAVVGTPALFAFVAFCAGALIAPAVAAQSVLVSRLAPSHYATEAFTWSSTFIVSGLGCGMALGGQLIERVGLRPAFVAGAVVVGAMSVVTLAMPPARRADAVRAAD